MTAASAGGTVSESGMAQLFSDLAAELTTDNATLSSSQLTDLQTIAANLNVGETASTYVTYITDALIDGNAANAKWTGGAASTTALGNLAVGATATQISELDGKWFLGTDLPSATVKMAGYSTFSVTYSAVTSPVFGAGGPSMNDINQGYLGDCYLLASLAEVADQNPSIIQSMITNNGNNTYGVQLYVDGNAEYVTVNDALADGGTEFNYATNIWASLVEKAYAQIQASGVITGNSVNYGNSFSTIGNGGDPEYALEEITDAPTITDFDAGGSSWSEYVYNDAFATLSSSSGLTTASVLAGLVTDLGEGYDLVLSSYTNATASNGMTTLVADHALSIYAYDSTTGDLEIRNPWGTREWSGTWETTFEVSLGTLLSDGDTISVANVPGSSSSSVVIGALVSAAAGLQANAAVTSFTISDTLADVSAAFASLALDSQAHVDYVDRHRHTVAEPDGGAIHHRCRRARPDHQRLRPDGDRRPGVGRGWIAGERRGDVVHRLGQLGRCERDLLQPRQRYQAHVDHVDRHRHADADPDRDAIHRRRQRSRQDHQQLQPDGDRGSGIHRRRIAGEVLGHLVHHRGHPGQCERGLRQPRRRYQAHVDHVDKRHQTDADPDSGAFHRRRQRSRLDHQQFQSDSDGGFGDSRRRIAGQHARHVVHYLGQLGQCERGHLQPRRRHQAHVDYVDGHHKTDAEPDSGAIHRRGQRSRLDRQQLQFDSDRCLGVSRRRIAGEHACHVVSKEEESIREFLLICL